MLHAAKRLARDNTQGMRYKAEKQMTGVPLTCLARWCDSGSRSRTTFATPDLSGSPFLSLSLHFSPKPCRKRRSSFLGIARARRLCSQWSFSLFARITRLAAYQSLVFHTYVCNISMEYNREMVKHTHKPYIAWKYLCEFIYTWMRYTE